MREVGAEAPERGGTGGARLLSRTATTRWARLTAAPEAGMSTAEYAVGTVAACGLPLPGDRGPGSGRI